MSGLVGEYGVDIVAYCSLVYGIVLAEVPRQQDPVLGMAFLVPVLKVAQAILVVTLQRTALDVEETGYGGAGDGKIIQDRL